MRLSSFSSKSIFLTSLACFSLIQLSEIRSECNGFSMQNGSCSCCGGNEDYSPNYSYIGSTPASVGASSCQSGCIDTFVITTLELDPANSGNNPTLNVDTNNTYTGTFVVFNWINSGTAGDQWCQLKDKSLIDSEKKPCQYINSS